MLWWAGMKSNESSISIAMPIGYRLDTPPIRLLEKSSAPSHRSHRDDVVVVGEIKSNATKREFGFVLWVMVHRTTDVYTLGWICDVYILGLSNSHQTHLLKN